MLEQSLHGFLSRVADSVLRFVPVAQRHERIPAEPCGVRIAVEPGMRPFAGRAVPARGVAVGRVQGPRHGLMQILRDEIVADVFHQRPHLLAGPERGAVGAVFGDRVVVHVDPAGVDGQVVGPAIARHAEVDVEAGRPPEHVGHGLEERRLHGPVIRGIVGIEPPVLLHVDAARLFPDDLVLEPRVFLVRDDAAPVGVPIADHAAQERRCVTAHDRFKRLSARRVRRIDVHDHGQRDAAFAEIADVGFREVTIEPLSELRPIDPGARGGPRGLVGPGLGRLDVRKVLEMRGADLVVRFDRAVLLREVFAVQLDPARVESEFVHAVAAVGVNPLVQHLHGQDGPARVLVGLDHLARDGVHPMFHIRKIVRVHRRGRFGKAPARGHGVPLHVDARRNVRVVLRQDVIGQRAEPRFRVDVRTGLRDAVHALLPDEADELQHVGAVVQPPGEIVRAAGNQRVRRRVVPPRDVERHHVDVHLLEVVELNGPVRRLVAVVGIVGRPDEDRLAVDVQDALFNLYLGIHQDDSQFVEAVTMTLLIAKIKQKCTGNIQDATSPWRQQVKEKGAPLIMRLNLESGT